MKLIVAIIQDYDTDPVLRALTKKDFRVTRIGSTGGFLRDSNSTLILGVQDDQVTQCLTTISEHCQVRKEDYVAEHSESWIDPHAGEISDVTLGGGVILVLPIERFEQF